MFREPISVRTWCWTYIIQRRLQHAACKHHFKCELEQFETLFDKPMPTLH